MRLIVNSKYEPVDKIAITQICNNPKPENRFCVNAPCILSIFIYFLYFFFVSVYLVYLFFLAATLKYVYLAVGSSFFFVGGG